MKPLPLLLLLLSNAPCLLVNAFSDGNLTRRATGDKHCSNLMCVSATAQDSTVEYVLSSVGSRTVGWMAIGFGKTMIGSPMVIMWANADGNVTLSQRLATAYSEPAVDRNPPRVASVSTGSSSTSGSPISLAFTIPANSDTQQDVIFAFGTSRPSSSDVAASMTQHLSTGQSSLNLAGDLQSETSSAGASGTNGASTPTSTSHSATDDIPLTQYQRMIVVHGIFCVVGFLVLMPIGALLARYARTFTPVWFTGHWITQVVLSGPVVVIGLAFGVSSVNKAGAAHLDDDHKRWGVAIMVLYFVQCAFGAVIHFVKPTKGHGRRPPQNYLHAIAGIIIIALAFKQVRNGFLEEWPATTGRDALPKSVERLWVAWVVILPILYLVGLALLPRQFKQEKAARVKNKEQFVMNSRDGYSD